MKLKLILIVLLLSLNTGFAQFKIKPYFIEQNSFINLKDSSITTYVSFRIRYNVLVFVKKDSLYEAGVTFSVEAKNNNTPDELKREFVTVKALAKNYSETEDVNKYVQGLLKIKLDKGNNEITPFVDLDNTDLTRMLRRFEVNSDSLVKNDFSYPVIVKNKVAENQFGLLNFGNYIPFSNNRYSLLFPYTGTKEKINVSFVQNNKTVYDTLLDTPVSSSLDIVTKGNEVVVEQTAGNHEGYFRLNTPNVAFEEGLLKVLLSTEKDSSEFLMNVNWISKPFSLTNPEMAARLLNIVFDEESLEPVRESDKDTLYSALVNFWENKDPISETPINELMNEFYSRVDYAIVNYSSLDKRNGADTDRGKTYIKFGRPDTVKRGFNKFKKSTEIWTYNKVSKSFIFVDESGLGNYTLQEE